MIEDPLRAIKCTGANAEAVGAAAIRASFAYQNHQATRHIVRSDTPFEAPQRPRRIYS